jgi:hypothetical protein
MIVLPPASFFRLTCRCPFVARMPQRRGRLLLDLPDHARLPLLPPASNTNNFARIAVAWNRSGLGIEVVVTGKREPPRVDLRYPKQSDRVEVWLDTRDARENHRATRYCHAFVLYPGGSGADGDDPCVHRVAIPRAMEQSPALDMGQPSVRVHATGRGYLLEAFLPADSLHGFDPEANPRLGFFYWVHDNDLGDQTFGLDLDFPFSENPSLWHTLELVR